MSNIRPQQEQQPPPSTGSQLPPNVVSVDKIWNYGISFTLIALILLVGLFMIRAFWNIAWYKWNMWLANKTGISGSNKKHKQKRRHEEEEYEDEDEEEEEQEDLPSPPPVPKRRGGGGGARRR